MMTKEIEAYAKAIKLVGDFTVGRYKTAEERANECVYIDITEEFITDYENEGPNNKIYIVKDGIVAVSDEKIIVDILNLYEEIFF